MCYDRGIMIKQIEYIVADLTNYKYDESELTLTTHICNDSNKMASGLALALSKKWPEVKSTYHRFKSKLGQIEKIKVGKNHYVINMIAQSDCGGYTPIHSPHIPPIRYECLYECMIRIRENLIQNNVTGINFYTGLIGSGLAGGNWGKITEIVYGVFNIDAKVTYNVKWFCLNFTDKEAFFNKDCRNV